MCPCCCLRVHSSRVLTEIRNLLVGLSSEIVRHTHTSESRRLLHASRHHGIVTRKRLLLNAEIATEVCRATETWCLLLSHHA
jgi:hypothetical protein